MQNKWKCIKDAFGIIYWWLPLRRVGLPPQHSEGRIDFDREKESEFAPPPPPPSSGTPAIPDSLGTIKVVADSLYWTSAFGAYLTMSDAVYFVTYPDSSYEYSPYSAGWANEYPGISSCYANVYVGSGYKLT